MSMTEDQAADYVDRMAMALGLDLDPAYRAGVIANMVRTAEIAGLVMDFPLPADLEPGFVFDPGTVDER